MNANALLQPLSMYAWGIGNALFLLVASAVISTVLALVLTFADIYGPRSLSRGIRVYSWLAQTTPPLILLFLVFYGFTSNGITLSPMNSALIAFIAFATAYNFEIFRASFDGVPKDQFEAARALGIPLSQTLTRIVFPQMLPIAIGPYVGRATVLLKETSLASAISVSEIMNVTGGQIYAGGNPLLLIGIAGGIYIVLNLGLIAIESRMSRRVATTHANAPVKG
ncbi:amino acid ABC transporter permease [Microvirga alba]|uniref:ABC transporter permease subunit n=1 Tax=Microvirga alba TaxID=2791025 RepID=A0A931BTM0_9HYPH|nr:ABC transporter permease subunit [Microvirga alba]MBF9235494.1 ABC transporter permease subunit [Microvirga alba]